MNKLGNQSICLNASPFNSSSQAVHRLGDWWTGQFNQHICV